jgi:hypothetical protein
MNAQTCCSSGVPIASNIGFQPQSRNVLQISLAYENNRLATLYNETDVLDGNNRLRTTNTGLARIAYNIHKRVIIEAMIPYVHQTRSITQNNGQLNEEGGHGIGDVTFLGQYVLIENQFSTFSVGGGIKLPSGTTDLENSIGILLVNDLQIGTGAIDYLARISTVRTLTLRPSVSFFLNATSVFRGTDNDYLGSESYKFGNEIQANVGYSDQVFFLKTLVYPSLSVRFRRALKDDINSNLLENTGGTWVFGRAALGIDLYKGNRLSVAMEYPLFTKVDGTQLSPSYILNLSYYKAIDFSASDF